MVNYEHIESWNDIAEFIRTKLKRIEMFKDWAIRA